MLLELSLSSYKCSQRLSPSDVAVAVTDGRSESESMHDPVPMEQCAGVMLVLMNPWTTRLRWFPHR
jgi:hypothetical protein